jgi:hypothetical protein
MPPFARRADTQNVVRVAAQGQLPTASRQPTFSCFRVSFSILQAQVRGQRVAYPANPLAVGCAAWPPMPAWAAHMRSFQSGSSQPQVYKDSPCDSNKPACSY